MIEPAENGELIWSVPNWETRRISDTKTFCAFAVMGSSLILTEVSYKNRWTRCETVRNGVYFSQQYDGVVYGENAAVEIAKRFERKIAGAAVRQP